MSKYAYKPLQHNGENDYTLKEGESSVWISVENLSIYIYKRIGGVSISVYEREKEAEKELDHLCVYYPRKEQE